MTTDNETIYEDNILSVRTLTSTPYILEGIINKLYVLVEINAKEQDFKPDERNPLELSIVLDHSGSMSGKKLENSKLALIQVVENLHNQDKIHLVKYDSEVSTVFNNGNLKARDQLVTKIQNIEARGSTNLMGGVLQGFNEIQLSSDSTHSKRIFLFSDGLVNQGIKEPSTIYDNIHKMRENGVNVSTFGIGSDFDEDLMTGIAETGGGDYYFIDGADTIPDIVSEGLGGLLDVVASNVRLQIRGNPGSTVTRFYGYDMASGADLGDVKVGESRQFLVEVEVKSGEYDDTAKFLNFEISYNPIDDLTSQGVMKNSVEINKTTDDDLITKENEEILVLRNLLETAREEQEIIKEVEQGNFDIALEKGENLSLKLKKVRNTVSQENAELLDDKINMLEQSIVRNQRAKTSGSRIDQLSSIKAQKYSSYMTKSSKKRVSRPIDDEE